MYGVSNAYKAAMLAPVQERTLRGTIGAESFDAGDIIAGSFMISNQAMDSTNITFGSVYIGELRMTVSSDFPISRKEWRGITVTAEIGLKVNGAYEYVPAGVYTITKSRWSMDGVEITAYDNMMFFDKTFSGREYYNNLTPYQYLTAACTNCGITLGNTQAQIEAMANGTETLEIYEENDVKTWRDLISCVAQALGGFATINRSGELEIREYGSDTGITIDASKRYSGALLSDYSTHYTGIGIVLTEQNQYYYRAMQTDDGETMKLGENPLLQSRLKPEIDGWLDNLLDTLESFEFTPYKARTSFDIAFDLGDTVTFTEGIASQGGDICCIMAFSYHFGRNYESEGYGDDPQFADVQSKVVKNLDGIRNTQIIQQKDIDELKESALKFLLPNDTSDDPIADGEENTVAEWTIECAEGAEIALVASICFEIETTSGNDTYTDAEMTATIKIDDVTIETYTETYGDGVHTFALSHILTMEVGGIYTITLDLAMDGGNLE